jgi:excisionase family DNA binding protein
MTAPPNGSALSLAFPPELVEAIAERAAEMLAERQRPAAHELMSVDEAAELLRCRRQRVYDLLSQGRLPHLKDGARVLIRRAEILSYLEGER